MLDTNVLVSAIVLDSPTMNVIVEHVESNHRMLVGSYVLDELRSVVARKWPDRLYSIECFIETAGFEVVTTPSASIVFPIEIRDPNDVPVLAQAIAGKADVLVTGDKDFHNLPIDCPTIVTPAQHIMRFLD